MYAYYLALEKPSEGHTKDTYTNWRKRNPDLRLNMDSNKISNVRRNIMNCKRLTDFELREIREQVRKDLYELDRNTSVLRDIPLDTSLSNDNNDPSQVVRNNVAYDDLDSQPTTITTANDNHSLSENSNNIQDNFDVDEFIQFSHEIIELMEYYENLPINDRENLTKISPKSAKSKSLLAMANAFIRDTCENIDMSLSELNLVMYASAKAVEKWLGIKTRKQETKRRPHLKPKWKRDIEKEIEFMRGEISILSEIERDNDPKTRRSRKLKRKFKIKNKEEIPHFKEMLKQKMQVKAQRLRRFEKRNRFYRQNRLFQTNAKKFYRELGKNQISVKEAPLKDEIHTFWNNIWGKEKGFNSSAEWVKNTERENSEVCRQNWEHITVTELRAALSKSQKWKSPGIDKVPNFWLSALSSSHVKLTKLFNETIENPDLAPSWFCQGTTFLLPKTNETLDPKNYRPITCLSTSYKILTSVLSERLYKHLDENKIFPIEQKGCKRGSYGCKDQLLINKMILENCKRRAKNLSCAWIDYKKAFDSVPHSWILKSLEMCKVSPVLINFLEGSMKKWATNLFLSHEGGSVTCENLKIKSGIFQGDSLSPLLFCIALFPLSIELNSSSYGYEINNRKISHLFYMDDLKLFGRNDSELEGLLKIVKGFSDDIGMEFGISKCAKVSFIRGKLRKTCNVQLDENTTIKDLEQEHYYKYLGVDEGEGIQHAAMREKLRRELLRRTRLILKTDLNSKNKITAINTLALPVITYSYNIIHWNLTDIRKLDVKIRKLLTTHNMHHPKSDVERLYLPRCSGGRGIIQLELAFKTAVIGMKEYLDHTDDWMMQLVFNHESRKNLHSIVKNGRKFATELGVNTEQEINEDLPLTENVRRLKRKAKINGTELLDATWKSKPLHGQFASRCNKADVDKIDTHQWLRSAGLKAETEGFIMAAQDQSLFTRNYQANIIHDGTDPKCRVCASEIESIDHIVSGCKLLANNEYTIRHDRVAQYIHWNICNFYDIVTTSKWYENDPPPVVDNDKVTILWNFPIHTDRTINANKPDIVVKDKLKNTCQLIEISVPMDRNVSATEFRKVAKYIDLEIEISKMWKMKTTTIPVIIGALGMIKKGTKDLVAKIPGKSTLDEIQKIVLNGTAHILRRFLHN